MKSLREKLFGIGIIPVIAINDAKDAVPLARALVRGGIPTAEITFRTPAAADAIVAVARDVPEILPGAGTVTSVEMAQCAAEAGAKYLVSPGLNPEVVKWCLANNIPVLPGVSTPTEIEAAVNLGLDTLKFFPAEASGGTAMLKAFSGPYRDIQFVPTGGIGPKNLNSYLDLPNVVACGGSWMAPAEWIDRQEFDVVSRVCADSVQAMHGFHLLHIGLNSSGREEADALVHDFAGMFGLPVFDGEASAFAGTMMEVMKRPFFGKKGHIAVGCNNVERAMAYFQTRGLSFRKEGMARDRQGLIAVYLEHEIGGFAIHLRRRL